MKKTSALNVEKFVANVMDLKCPANHLFITRHNY